MAALQIIDPTAAKHNYANKEVVGHANRTSDDEAYAENVYANSIFDQLESGE